MGSIEAILWDNDGVLVDTEPIYFESTRAVLAEIGVTLDLETYKELFLASSGGAWHLAYQRGYTDDEVQQLRRRRDMRYVEALRGNSVEIPGVRDVLEALRERYRMAIVTSSRREPFEAVHRKTGLTRYFEFALVREDYTRSKPDPEPYLLAAQRLGIPAAKCLVIEDSERGLRAASAAGMRCWVIPNGMSKNMDFRDAERVVSDIRDVRDALTPNAAPPPGLP